MMKRTIVSCAYRAAAIFLLVLILMGGIGHQTAFAEESLPIHVENQGDLSIEVFPIKHQLIVRMKGQIIKKYKVAVGNPSTPTPIGDYKVVYKGKDWGPSFGPRWIGLNVPWGTYGIHGTNKPNSIGQHLSHGCIRMRNRDVTELYDLVPIGSKVTIYGHVLGEPGHDPRNLAEGDVGGDVQLIQSRLRSAGYFHGNCDGKFRADTTAALKKFQRDHQLIPNGVVGRKVYEELGLLE